MLVFIDFWKLETENSLLHVFSFLHKLSFENSFCFLPVLSCQTSFLDLKIENCFWKLKIRGKNSYQTYPKFVVHGREKAKMSFWSKHYKGKIIMDGREWYILRAWLIRLWSQKQMTSSSIACTQLIIFLVEDMMEHPYTQKGCKEST